MSSGPTILVETNQSARSLCVYERKWRMELRIEIKIAKGKNSYF